MPSLRSILWVGRARELDVESVAATPSLDVAWARDVGDALALPLAAFDALVLDAEDPDAARRDLARLGEAGAPPVVVRVPGDAPVWTELRRAGAASVLRRAPQAGSGHGLAEVLAALPSGRPRRGPLRAARAAKAPAEPADATPRIVGRSPALRALLDLVARAARSRATVLLAGETGTGKELLAREVHRGSTRREGPFLAINCAAFPDTLLESELFGHVRGAFTGAERARSGVFEQANGGTLFLDEIGETSPSLQAKLLRALQEREVRPVGGARARPVDVWVIAATNRELRAEIAAGHFRADLYYRLAVFPVNVPPLRARPEDVLPLAEHFLQRHGAREGKPDCRLAGQTADLLRAHTWPGNVRELENEMQRALALVEAGAEIQPEQLSAHLRAALDPMAEAGPRADSLRETLARVEAWLIRRALDAHGGRRSATARTLGITREGLYKKMKRYGIE